MTISEIVKKELENCDIDLPYYIGKPHVKRLLTSLTKRIIESEIEFARSKLHKDCFDGEAILTGRAKGYNQALKYIISHLESELKLINEN